MFNIQRLLIPRYLIEHSLDEGSVLRMGSVQYKFHGGFVDAVEFENSKRLVRPNKVPPRNTPSETTRATRFLGFRQIGLTLQKCLFGMLTLKNLFGQFGVEGR